MGILWWCDSPLALDLAWPLRAPLTFLLLALVYPVLEELVFRGALQGALTRQTWGGRKLGPISLANFFTSLVFAGFHLFYHAPLWAALVFLPSLIFGYFRDRHQSVRPAIVLHVFYNAGYFWLFTP
ncbi:MAG: JDVT-CTERM system glutamic-type intramembrane protease [Gammaproteobacteria bacterium]